MERCLVLVLVGVMIGCGPAVDADESSSGSRTSSGGSSTADESTGSAETSTIGTDTGSLCGDIRNGEVPNLVIPVEITNTLQSPVYVGYESDCLIEVFKLSRPDGSAVDWHGRACTPSCDEVMAGECFDCGGCPPPTMVRIPAGATYSYEFHPVEYDLLDFPAECAELPCSPICDRRYGLPDGQYTFEVVASTYCDGDGMSCDCADGEPCEVYPWSWPETTLSASAQVSLPAGAVSLTIE